MPYTTPGGIVYRDMEGSPTFGASQGAMTASAVWRIAWTDSLALMQECFPEPAWAGGEDITENRLQFPSMAWLYCTSCRVEPLDPQNPNNPLVGANYNAYVWAKATLEFSSRDADDVVEHRMAIGAEFMKMPASGFGWLPDALSVVDPATTWSLNLADWQQIEQEDLKVGKLVPLIEHTFTFKRVRYPPWTTIANTLGKVNSTDKVSGYEVDKGTLLFEGVEAGRRKTTTGTTKWQLEYKFSQRKIGETIAPDIGMEFANEGEAVGWNHQWNKDRYRWERIVDQGGNYLYQSADLNDLFKEDPPPNP